MPLTEVDAHEIKDRDSELQNPSKTTKMSWIVVQTYLSAPSPVAAFVNKDQALIYFDALRRIDERNIERTQFVQLRRPVR
jgi:hypothetical protein